MRPMAIEHPLAITIGDPGGIGPEVALRALAERKEAALLVGPESLWRHHAAEVARIRPELREPLVGVLQRCAFESTDDPEEGAKATLGETNRRHGLVAARAVERAVALVKEGRVGTIVTAPLNKDGLKKARVEYPGHTEMLRDLAGVEETTMAFVGGGLKVALATIHVPLRTIWDLLTPELIARKAAHLHAFVKRLGTPSPRIGLAGLNPHAGEGGLFGDEEETILRPAQELAREQGVELLGPYPPDTIFFEARQGRLDAVLALYHDQALIAVKTIAFDSAVNVTLGMPFFRTSPDHGTAFDVAGQGIANTGSMKVAIALARDLVPGEVVT